MASKGETAATTMLLLVALVMSFTSTTVTADPVVIPNPIDIVGPGLNLFCSLRVNNGKPCNDSNVCTLNDKCMNGKCKGTASKICLDVDNIACTVPACDPVKGCYMKPVDSKCPGFPLNKCLLPKCDFRTGCTSTPRNCDDNNACTVDSCHPLLGCVRKPIKCDDGNPCTRDWCHTKLGCQHTPVPGLKCDDGNRCTVGDKCDANGQCQPGTQELSCNDNNPCTLDRCDPKGGCIHTPLTGTACDDGKQCTIGDRCVEGKCVGITKNCDDGNICTADRCNPNTGDCVHVGLTGQQCNDNIPCTTGDQCVQGVCRGIPQDVLCNDNNPCTLDKCSPTGGCIYKALSDVACNDGDKCTTTDKCVEGKCVGTPKTCGDGNQCTADRCDPDTGNCINRPLSGVACDDGFACTVEDQCIEGKCQGKPVDSLCDDKNECTVEKCTLTGGCVRKPIEDGSTCDDGDKCTVEDQCKDGRCVGKRLTDCVPSGRTP